MSLTPNQRNYYEKQSGPTKPNPILKSNLEAGFNAAQLEKVQNELRDSLAELDTMYGGPFTKATSIMMAETTLANLREKNLNVYAALIGPKPASLFGLRVIVENNCPRDLAYLMYGTKILYTLKLA